MERPRGTLLDVIRSPFICGAGPDSERCGRRHATALSKALSCHPEADLDTFTAVWIGWSEQAHCRFNGEAPQRNAMFIQSVIAPNGSCQNRDTESPHSACRLVAHRTDGWTNGWTDTLAITKPVQGNNITSASLAKLLPTAGWNNVQRNFSPPEAVRFFLPFFSL